MNEAGAVAAEPVMVSDLEEEVERGLLFPFSALVGQESLKRALLLNAINPNISGVLVWGPKGCGKTTSVRGLVEVLPDIEVVKGCRFSCDPKAPGKFCDECKDKFLKGTIESEARPVRIVGLPLHASEETLVGRLDPDRVEALGLDGFDVGAIGLANRGFVLVERVNLVDPGLLKLLMDLMHKSKNTVEAGGLRITHPAKFNVIATMNSEEGDIPRVLQDKIDIILDVERVDDVEQRIEIVKRVAEFERDPLEFRSRFREGQRRLKARVAKAQETLPTASIPTKVLETISKISKELETPDYRANILRRVTLTNAVFERRIRASLEDFVQAANMSLPRDVKRTLLRFEEAEEVEEMVEKRTLEVGYNYLFTEEKTYNTFDVFRDTVKSGVPGICITTTYPPKVIKEHGMDGFDIIWLSDMDAKDETITVLNPKRLDFEIARTITGFIKDNKEGSVIMLDGFEYLVMENSFDKVLKFTKKVNDLAAMNGATIVVPVNPSAFKREQTTILKKEFDKVEKG